ncbi:MAG: GNAT family N-acetyltransferase [Gammaproteobacteria bacterium]|nr:GNAT family N-acetyltransferase [Gammaproteobacteria bacterium]
MRTLLVVKVDNKFSGYVTIKWNSEYSKFNEQNIPEISDLNVLPEYRKQGIATALIKECEIIAKNKGIHEIGLGVGMTEDYGRAQRLYVQLGYLPDGEGLHYKNKKLKYNENTTVDDELVLYFKKYISSMREGLVYE